MGYGTDLKFGMDSWVEDRRGITEAIFEFPFLSRAMGEKLTKIRLHDYLAKQYPLFNYLSLEREKI